VNTIKAVHGQCRYSQGIYRSEEMTTDWAQMKLSRHYFNIHRAVSEHHSDEIEKRVNVGFDVQDEAMLKLDIHKNIPELLLDNTDRNRTSPFAFTGNKFEFRAVGSSANPAMPMTVLNTIVADSLNEFKKRVDELIDNGEKKEIAILQIIQKYIVESKKILFEGDGYSDDWEKEAAARGLENVKVTPLALDAMISRKSKELFERHQIFSDNELEARYEILLESYTREYK